jgi:hypothetical protein
MQGAKELASGVFDGVTGIVMEPFKGAERDGITGFGKGIVRGVVGVALKPVVGVFDFGARTFEVRTCIPYNTCEILGEFHILLLLVLDSACCC